ncbi:integumentary mucin C.1 isoform X6 [Dunckerocampus dactyliophorus]|uniref:integumentary mucin C.1 isoform X6 n=1 Tax=Dunckerocampus dactyliophorus TaxID=161453 RepID=UPI00240768B4|nr:integumentary mucin C.1 isoform X6 [Dunckerocampus dactyliophorus]
MPYTVYVRYCDVIITGLANNSPFLSSPAMTIMIATTSTIHTGCSAIMPSHLLLLGLLIMPGFTSGATSTAPTSSVSMVATSTPATTQSISSTTSRAMPMSTTTMMTAASPSSVSSNTDSWTSMMSTTQTTTSTGSMTSMMTTAMNMIYCPEFSCNYSDCNTMYASQNTTPCAAGQWCKLCKMDMYYMASCSASCNDSCMNDSQTNCSVACCNYTGCLNATFASMVIMPSTAAAPTAAPVTTAMANPQPTTSDDGNKCNQGMCTGATCYTSFSSTLQTCSSSDLHCQLKKETVGSDLKWTAGCTANCSSETTCTATTQPPCHLECCNVTMTSCLWLNGTMNFPSSAIRGPRIHAELTASLLCLLVALGFLQ